MRTSPLIALGVSVVALATGCDRGNAATDAAGPRATVAAADAAAPVPTPSAPVVKVETPEIRVRASADTTVRLTWSAPPGTGINDEAPVRVRWNRSDGLAEAPKDMKSTGNAVKDGLRVTVRPMAGAPNATLGGEIDLVVCDVATHSVCVPVRRSLELGFVVVNDGPPDASVSIPLPQAKAN